MWPQKKNVTKKAVILEAQQTCVAIHSKCKHSLLYLATQDVKVCIIYTYLHMHCINFITLDNYSFFCLENSTHGSCVRWDCLYRAHLGLINLQVIDNTNDTTTFHTQRLQIVEILCH